MYKGLMSGKQVGKFMDAFCFLDVSKVTKVTITPVLTKEKRHQFEITLDVEDTGREYLDHNFQNGWLQHWGWDNVFQKVDPLPVHQCHCQCKDGNGKKHPEGKKPAHELVIEVLRRAIHQLAKFHSKEVPDDNSDRQKALGVAAGALMTLRGMVIPEKHQSEVLESLKAIREDYVIDEGIERLIPDKFLDEILTIKDSKGE